MLERLSRIRFVLVNTQQPGNIGGALRAMKNMGLSRLVLVQPEVFPSDRAVWRAAGAADLLGRVVVTDTLDEAIADCRLVIGTSARERRIAWPLENPRGAARRAVEVAADGDIAFVFGREHSGLTNDELQRCNVHVHIPSNPDYSSLNLSAAVQVLAYELRMAVLDPASIDYANLPHDEPLASSADNERFYQHLERVLKVVGFLDPDNPRQTMARMRRLFNRTGLDEVEIAILRGLLTGIEQALPEGRGKPGNRE